MERARLTYESLERDITAWANEEPSIQAAVVVGSRARTSPPPDRWSDMDLILFVTDLSPYLAQTAWFEQFGKVWMSALEDTGAGDPEWYILYEPGVKLDVVIYALREDQAFQDLPTVLQTAPFGDVIGRGTRVLIDKNSRAEAGAPELAGGPAKWVPPTAAAFDAVFHKALFTAVNAAKFTRRGDLWRAKQLCDGELKKSLLRMLEWQAHAAHPEQADVWFEGRFIDRWVDPDAAKRIPAAFAVYDTEDLHRALQATLDLFFGAARDTADRLGYPYPADLERDVSQMIQDIRAT